MINKASVFIIHFSIKREVEDAIKDIHFTPPYHWNTLDVNSFTIAKLDFQEKLNSTYVSDKGDNSGYRFTDAEDQDWFNQYPERVRSYGGADFNYRYKRNFNEVETTKFLQSYEGANKFVEGFDLSYFLSKFQSVLMLHKFEHGRTEEYDRLKELYAQIIQKFKETFTDYELIHTLQRRPMDDVILNFPLIEIVKKS